jgi:7,8-dihydroneopterin aldolase/epimerase/oxygenase
MDIIFISELRVETLVGIYDWERKVPQKIQLDLEIGLPARKSGSDKLGDTIDYAWRILPSRSPASS